MPHHTTWREANRQKLVTFRMIRNSDMSSLRSLRRRRISLFYEGNDTYAKLSLPPGVARWLTGFAEESGSAGMNQA